MQKRNGAGGAAALVQVLNLDSVPLLKGYVVSVDGEGGATRWDGVSDAAGMMKVDTQPGQVGIMLLSGPLTMEDWTEVTGTETLGQAHYWADPNDLGKLTWVVPTTPSQLIQQVGYPVSYTTFNVQIEPAILIGV